jgi:TolA-binding protein
MTRVLCRHIWQAEAIEDGRLLGEERAAFERHKEVCGDCAREVAALDRLRRAAGRLPVASITPLERRRQRGALLRRANELAMGRRRGSRGVWVMAAALMFVASVSAAAVMALRSPAPALAPSPVLTSPPYEVTPGKGAAWGADASGGIATKEANDMREEGVKVAPAIKAAEARPGPPAPKLGAATARPRGGPRASTTSEVRLPSRLAAASAGAAFTEAMSAFSDGDFARAERLFSVFERDHAGDARVEDATFLRAVARSRRGDRAGAASLAREYLRRFPNGLRRIEAERLASP